MFVRRCRCVLVGDPQQLPATVLSQRSKELAFDRSLFQRLQLAGWPTKMLRVQYRMHAHIRQFPSAHFYNNQLIVRFFFLWFHRCGSAHSALLRFCGK